MTEPVLTRFARLMALGCAMTLAACGGGTADPLSLSFAPASVSVSADQGESTSFDVTVHVTGSVADDFVVVVLDPDEVVEDGFGLEPLSDDRYEVTFRTEPGLSSGQHRGALEVLLCSNFSCGTRYGKAKLPYSITVHPLPNLVSISPSRAFIGSSDQTVTLSGSAFRPDTQVYFAGALHASSYRSSTELTMPLSADDLAQAGRYPIQVGSGNVLSQPQSLEVRFPDLSLQSLSPDQVLNGSDGLDVTIAGTGFLEGFEVRLNGALPDGGYRYVSSTEMALHLTSEDLAESRIHSVTVVNTARGGGSSSAVSFAVNNPAPSLSLINAKTAKAGCGRFVLSVVGSHFLPGVEILWNGSPRPTTQVSDSLLRATIEASDIASAGDVSVSLRNPAPTGSNSNAAVFRVTADGAGTTAATHQRLNASRSLVASTDCPVSAPTEPIWTYIYDSAELGIPNQPLVAGGKVIVGDYAGRYVALDAETGTPRWGPIATGLEKGAAYGDGSLFVVGGDSQYSEGDGSGLAAYDAADGSLRYRLPLPVDTTRLFGVTVANGLVYGASSGNQRGLHAFLPANGDLAWWVANTATDTSSFPAANGNSVYVAAFGRGQVDIRAFNPSSGSLLWQVYDAFPTDIRISLSDGFLHSLQQTGTSRLREADGAKLDTVGQSYRQDFPCTAAHGNCYSIAQSRLFANSLSDNSVVWTLDGVVGSPVVVNDLVLSAGSSMVFAVDATTGIELWRVPFPPAPPGSGLAELTIGDGYLVIAGGKQVNAFSLTSRH